MDAHRSEDDIDAEVEVDGTSHFKEMLEKNEEFRRVWEANRAGREHELEELERRLGEGQG